MGGQGTCPLLFEVRPVFCPPTFSSLRPKRCVPFHAVIMIYDNDENVLSPLLYSTDTAEID